MFMCSGQLFSHGDNARSWQTPARQRLARMWSSNSWRKWRSVVRTEFGADWPSPHSDVSRIIRAEFVQLGEVLLAAFALGDARQRAQRLVEADPAGRAFAARLRIG